MHLKRCAFVALITLVLAAVQSLLSAPSASGADEFCSPNSSSYSPESADTQCLDGIPVTSTRTRLSPDCITDGKALEYGATYGPFECKNGYGVQAEAIAQARAIAWYNHVGVRGGAASASSSSVSPNIQWEPILNNDATPKVSYTRGGQPFTPATVRPDIVFL